MRYLNTTRQKKTFKIAHMDPGVFHLDYIVLPVGYSYNAEIANAKKGDVLRLADGGEYPIFSVRRIRADKPEADILCRIRYGVTLKGAMMRWKMNAKLEGHGAKAVSEDECLWVIFERNEQD